MKNRNLLVCLILSLPPLLWAGNFIVGRAANSSIPPLTLALSRHIVALLFLLPFGWSIMYHDLPKYWKYRWKILQTSLSGMVFFNVLVYIALHSTTASNAQLLNSTIPALIVLISAIVFRKRLALFQVLGLIISCLGVLTIILQGDITYLFSLKFSYGDLIIFVSMVSFSFFSVWLREFPEDLNRVGLLGIQFVIAVLILAPLAGAEWYFGAKLELNVTSYAAMLYVGVAAGLIANLLYMNGIAHVGPARAGLFIHLVPIYGAFMSNIFLGENLHWYHALGITGIISGLVLSQKGIQKHA
ncbi:DMT family transporter [Citrobacter amalonaticus]